MRLEYLHFAFDSIMHRKMRSWLNILSILIGITAVFALVSFGQGLSTYVNNLATEMGKDKIMAQVGGGFSSPFDERYFFTQEEMNMLERMKGVEDFTPMTMASAKIEKDDKRIYTILLGLDSDMIRLIDEMMTIKVEDGRDLKKGDIFKVVLGHNYQIPNKIFKKPLRKGDRIMINDVEMEVIGFYSEVGNPQDDSQIYMTIEGFYTLFPEEEGKYKYAIMRASSGEDPAKIAERATERLRKHRGLKKGEENFMITTFEQAIQTFGAILNIINAVLILIASISVVVAAVNIMNTMYTAVLERTREIGIMKAIGAKNSDILFIFIVESGVIGFIGAGLGVLFGYLIASAGGRIAAEAGYSMLKPVFPLWLIIGCLTFGFCLGAFSGLFPARHASRLKPVEALHYE
ncbi:ABC transporter permease [Candidatus Woesearchaeota archaeon]|nr:ABC transporter permease [Candidatus Woesearchaeota archaeon]